jgi:hypothetical protein
MANSWMRARLSDHLVRYRHSHGAVLRKQGDQCREQSLAAAASVEEQRRWGGAKPWALRTKFVAATATIAVNKITSKAAA